MDELDRTILAHLLRQARASFQEIGAAVGLSAPAVKRRVDRMVSGGQITGFTALVNPAALGWRTEAYVEVYYRDNISPAELRRSLEPIPQVVGVWTIAGEADALVHVMATDMADIESTVERIRENARVGRTRSSIVMSRLLERPRTDRPLDHPGA
ncbi:DNA-binding Lrp family transcriptional regulator [Nocardia transvalensis]|uniref:DNA-binding Lrp family transcriptional regulator n=1 Tax=Nocardia transvalensis TaxID=37333 RepID=A0A7W9PJE2_9NOCA|nr:Lrp/AsnC family transcriptional regulator [Nocardia transvalensis]MBB5917035.1 DNA-binding Lrp family transcriptional regulator [Nocardia transvalensis]